MRTLVLASLLVSSSAFACPVLSGHYASCRSTTGQTSGDTEVTVTQTETNGVTTYTWTSTDNQTHKPSTETMMADGISKTKTQTDAESGMTFTITSQAVCNGDTVRSTMAVNAMGQTLATITADYNKFGGQLIQKISGMNMGQPINDTVICQ